MVGFPWVTESRLQHAARVMPRMPCDCLIYSMFTPNPGTEAFQLCQTNGLLPDTPDYFLCHHQALVSLVCLRIAPQRFRAWCNRIEKTVDRRKHIAGMRRAQSLRVIYEKIKSKGLRENPATRAWIFSRR